MLIILLLFLFLVLSHAYASLNDMLLSFAGVLSFIKMIFQCTDIPVYIVSDALFLSLCCMHLRFIRIVAGSYGSAIFQCSITLQRCGLFIPYFLFPPLHFTWLTACEGSTL